MSNLNQLTQTAKLAAQQGDPRLLNLLSMAANNKQLQSKLEELTTRAQNNNPPEKLGFFGKLRAATIGALTGGAKGAVMGGVLIGGGTALIDTASQGTLSGRKIDPKKAFQHDVFLVGHNNLTHITDLQQKEPKFKDLDANIKPEQLEKLTAEEKKTYGEFAEALHNKIHAGKDEVSSMDYVMERGKISAIFSGVIGVLTGFGGGFQSAETARNEEIQVYEVIKRAEALAQQAQMGVPQGLPANQFSAPYTPPMGRGAAQPFNQLT